MLRIFGKETSINVRKVLWLCTELGRSFELEPWGYGVRDPQTPGFLLMNPNGQVPVIRDGDFVLWESNTICRYLAAQSGRHDLMPTDPKERARVEQWMDWQATDLNSAWRYVFMARVRCSPDYADVASVERSEVEWNRKMTLLDQQLLKTGAFVAGETFTLADIVIGLSINRWNMTPLSTRPVLRALEGYGERLASRDGFHRYCANGTP